ncbi:amino acid adenylation domain-containing protein [Pantanalinema rosaneae CENA516]|uniref:non-ribosomal peptide synthetase n=1 Tax=Pantanalinema rosaneae TaxID=1620701 RepID=UPI003D700AB3
MKNLNNREIAEPIVARSFFDKHSTTSVAQGYAVDYCNYELIHRVFESQVAQTPDQVAVEFEGVCLTYGELNDRANQLAHYLRTIGVEAEVLVGICLERSLDLVVGLLAVLKAGGAYVPLDPNYPPERLGFILEDAHISVLLTQSHLTASLPEHTAQMVCPEAMRDQLARYSTENLPGHTTPTNLAYVIYTSGSTGKPKGVAIEHHSPVALIRWASKVYTSAELAGVLAATSICFDLSVFELFVTLCLGGTVILAENALQLPRLQTANPVTLVNTVPSAIAALLRTQGIPASVKTVNLAGEPLQNRLVQDLYKMPTIQQVYNLYGPSEDTTYSTVALMEPGSQESPSIGVPIDGTQVYILDGDRQPVAWGEVGELYIGGAGLARGYLNRPELTAERFVSHLIGHQAIGGKYQEVDSDLANAPNLAACSRLYKTGDLVRWRADGNLEFLGRIDHQVKVRGFRIELGEIETVLWNHPDVQEAVVTVQADQFDNNQLIAYVVPKSNLVVSQIEFIRTVRDRLKQTLPDYMLPSGFVVLPELPLTPNGKIDRRSLPAFDVSQSLSDQMVAPRTATEQTLTRIWQEVLGWREIGIHDNFLELGGHSLLATQIVARIVEAFQIELSLRCLFERPTIAELAQHLESMLPVQLSTPNNRIQPQSRQQPIPLSYSQQQLWFLDQLVPNHPFYNVPEAIRLRGELDVMALEQSLQAIVQRHEILRTNFTLREGQPVQVIQSIADISLSIVDVSTAQEPESEAGKRMVIEAQRPFDLSRDQLIRVILFRLSSTEHILFLNLHHIICDEWSFKVLLEELTAVYPAYLQQRSAGLAPLPLQYADVAIWQRGQSQAELESQLAYWSQQLNGAPAILQLPTDYPRSPRPSHQGSRHGITLPPSLTAQLKQLSRQEGVTLYMTLLAAFQSLLCRYTGQTDICIGSPIANRHGLETEKLIGFFVNTLVFRTDLSNNPSFRELLHRVREVALAAYAHQDVPFDTVVQAVQPHQRDTSYNPLFQVMFNLQNVPMTTQSMAGVTLSRQAIDHQTAKFDLSLDLTETADGITGFLEYSTDLFAPETIARLVGHLQTLLTSIAAQPEQRLATLPILTPTEVQQFAVWNQTQVVYPDHLCIHQLFAAQVERTPDAIAIVFGNDQLTYQELNQRSNQLARTLQQLGVAPEVLVGICVDRLIEMVVGMLAILKAGGAYVPLDPKYPSDRLAFMLEDSQAKVLLTQTHLMAALPHQSVQIVCVDDAKQFANQSPDNFTSDVQPHDLAYVIYTSGSTGKPKGVAIEHRSPVALIHWAQSVFTAEDLAVVLAATSICFDLSVFELFVTLSSGGKVVLAQSALCLPNLAHAQEVTLINTVPSAIAELLRIHGIPDSVRTVNLAGEPLLNSLVQQIYQQTQVQQVYNLYGPSEDTTYSTVALIPKDSQKAPPIGQPISNTQAYVLDGEKQRLPIGVPGELYLGGAGLARGYLHRPELTAERFIPNPFQPADSSLAADYLYKTGDLVRYTPDGNLEFLGRIDHQVKIRGFRIELGEIEATLRQYPSVREVVVIVREDIPAQKQLVAYLVSQSSPVPSISELRRFLQTQLPEYMLPAAFVLLEQMPLNPNGKVDRKALPAPDGDRPDLDSTYVAPRTDLESQLAETWARILQLETVGVQDNFFELGGNSLLAAQLMVCLQETFQIELPVRHLFEHPTIAGLARTVDALRRGLPVFTNHIDLAAEAVLDETIYPTGTPVDLAIVAQPNHIFLTGATGFLGAFVLSELLQQTQATLHCLVRAANVRDGWQRIQQNLERYQLWQPEFSTRIQAVPGDLGQPLLGLTRREFERLTEVIEVIYHNGAPVNFVKPYSAMKAETVSGTQEILRLACLSRVKPVHFISTVAVFGTIGYFTGLKMLHETTDLDRGVDYVHMGYTRSKWVAEKLMWMARSRGLPVTILRPGLVLGHSQTGMTKTDDYPSRLIKGCIQLGSFPDLVDQKEELIPVDYASRAIAHLTRQPESIGQVFHLVPQPGQNVDLVTLFGLIQDYGYPLKKLSYTEWKEELLHHTRHSQENALYPLLPFITDKVSQEQVTVMELYQNTPDYDDRNAISGLADTDITCPPVNAKLIETCFSYFIDSGFLEAPPRQ